MVQIRLQDLFGDVLTEGLWFSHSPAAQLKANQFILKGEQFCTFCYLHWTSLWSNRRQDPRFGWECLYNDFIHASNYSSSPYIWFSFYDQQNHPACIGSTCLLLGRISELRENCNDINHNWTEYAQITLQTVLQVQLYYILTCTDMLSKNNLVLSFLANTICFKLYPKQRILHKRIGKDKFTCRLFSILPLTH